jgi:plasmid maintenance system killer protein
VGVLKGDRKGQDAIRINEQYRICFVWKDDGVERVEIATISERRRTAQGRDAARG